MELPRGLKVGEQEDDDWTKVKDAVERKKIQNRLAQRLHRTKYGRKKKSDSKYSRDKNTNTAPPTGGEEETRGYATSQTRSEVGHDISDLADIDPSHLNSSPDSSEGSSVTALNVSRSLELFDALQMPNPPSPLTETNFLVLQTTHTITAMLFNASLLDIACSAVRGRAIFIPATASTPNSLAPTPLQLTLPHWPYIDILPLPALRNKLLQAHDIIDPRDIWQDLIDGRVKVWGSQSWDERGWEITEAFATKWWFLMDGDVLGTTNFWRAARGEKGLDVKGLKSKIGHGVGAA